MIDSEAQKIQEIEAKCFYDILTEFHNIALSKEKFDKQTTFWNLFATMREKYLKELEAIDADIIKVVK